jgi:citronellol/citronellal dehydrogenase
MSAANSLENKVIFITGASRGIGREMALNFARQGANIVVAAKTADPHPSLEGTIFTVSDEIERLGGTALPIQLDVRDEAKVFEAVQKVITEFGAIDVLINNASAIFLAHTLDTPIKRFDLIYSVNVRGTFLCSQACLPHLKKSSNPHILNLSPPLNMKPRWFKDNVAYTLSKYGMSMCTLGMAEEFKPDGVAVNSLWPRSTIATAAIEVNFPKEVYEASRKPAIMADAASLIVSSDSRTTTGNFFIDDSVLASHGITDLDCYSLTPGKKPYPDFFLDQ